MLQLNLLAQFKVVAELEHMSKAAEKLNIAQPSLSMNMRRLENELGVELFTRNGKSITLNESGRQFYKNINLILTELDDAVALVRSMNPASNPVTTAGSSTPDIIGYVINNLPEHFDASHFQTIFCGADEMRERLIKGTLDFGITCMPIKDSLFSWTPITNIELMAVVPKDHPLAGRKAADLRELQDETFIVSTPGFELHDHIISCCQRAGFTPKTFYMGNNPELFLTVVQRGAGISFLGLPKWEDVSDPSRPSFVPLTKNLRAIKINKPDCKIHLGAVTLKSRTLSNTALDLMDFTIKQLANTSKLK